jgi:hypothetical protein
MNRYQVSIFFQFPAWDERSGLGYVVSAKSKSDAIKQVRRLAERDGHTPARGKGRVTFSAEQHENEG